jgi:hypothetical protein
MPFETTLIPPIPFLAELREEVLKHSLKRMPKWKFRFAPDIVVQLQPKPTIRLSAAAIGRKPKYQYFVGSAVMMDGVTGEALKQLPRRPCPPWWQIKFEIYTHDPNADTDWVLDRTGGGWQTDHVGVISLFERIAAILRDGYFTTSMPPRMLSHHCIICGKGLTDPASMARWIGPECAGTSTLQVPFLITLDHTHAAAA